TLHLLYFFFFFTHTPPTPIYTLSLHDALPIYWLSLQRSVVERTLVPHRRPGRREGVFHSCLPGFRLVVVRPRPCHHSPRSSIVRSEEHTSELQSLRHLVCRLLLEKKNT